MSISANLDSVIERMELACARADRNFNHLTLIAVSKTWPAETIAEAAEAGQIDFGENKVQEILEKVPQLSDKLQWHLIGHLQKNKVRKVLPHVACIHSLDSVDLATRIDRISSELHLTTSVLLQVNVASDDAKNGFSVKEVTAQLAELQSFENIRIEGLMTVPPFDSNPEKTRPHFANLRRLRDQLAEKSGLPLAHLSMGMSHDFDVAIEEGSTLIRVGSSIFGERDYGTAS